MINKITVTRNDNYVMGACRVDRGFAFAYASKNPTLRLLLFSKDSKAPEYTIELDASHKVGNVFSVVVKGLNPEINLYLYEDAGFIVADPYATCLKSSSFIERKDSPYAVLTQSRFNWKGDVSPSYKRNELIIYKLHPKGWTAHESSKVKNRGTFKGITEKLTYLLNLGVNAVEIMPVYEFVNKDARKNYWGYEEGFYFAPKRDYCACKDEKEDYTVEFKELVRKFHEKGIEVILEMFFPNHVSPVLILDCIRFWKKEYHIDGVHLLCDERVRLMLAGDEYIRDVKLFTTNWYEDTPQDNLYEYNEGFLDVSRRLLKGDEGQLMSFLNAQKKSPEYSANVNFVAYNNGFTLADLVSYDHKHNEVNNEGNRDGVDYNLSWNCGAEGPTTNKRIKDLRFKLMKNAMAMVMLAQGVPLIYGGDEFANSQSGNNNAYCQDNEIGWTDWSSLKRNRKLYDFVKELIAFRKEHGAISFEKQPLLMDYKYYGLPDMSYHGSRAWYPELEHYNRHVGVMLCGRYAREESNIYVGYNLHWESHELALPTIPGRKWQIAMGTDLNDNVEIVDEHYLKIAPRSIIVLTDIKNG